MDNMNIHKTKNTGNKGFASQTFSAVLIIAALLACLYILGSNGIFHPGGNPSAANALSSNSKSLSTAQSDISSPSPAGSDSEASITASGESDASALPTVISPTQEIITPTQEIITPTKKTNSPTPSITWVPVTPEPIFTRRNGWSYSPSGTQGIPAKITTYKAGLCEKYDGIWQGDTTKKKVYITMDVGYEYNNNASKILDIAKAKNFRINFFITGALFKTDALKSLVLRMNKEGHLVGNHTWNHPSMPILYNTKGKNAVIEELDKVEEAYLTLTGTDISSYMRPPMGEFSEATMKLTQELGYKTVFWSFAYRDWETDKQPDPVTALKTIMENLHNGTVFLIHTVSNTNVQILPALIDEIRAKGYEIALISDIK